MLAYSDSPEKKPYLELHEREFTPVNKNYPYDLWFHAPEDYNPSELSCLVASFNSKAKTFNLANIFRSYDGRIVINYVHLLKWQKALKKEELAKKLHSSKHNPDVSYCLLNDNESELIKKVCISLESSPVTTGNENFLTSPNFPSNIENVSNEEDGMDAHEKEPQTRNGYGVTNYEENINNASNSASFWLTKNASSAVTSKSPQKDKRSNNFLTDESLKEVYNQLTETQKVLLGVFDNNSSFHCDGVMGDHFLKLRKHQYFSTKYTESYNKTGKHVNTINGLLRVKLIRDMDTLVKKKFIYRHPNKHFSKTVFLMTNNTQRLFASVISDTEKRDLVEKLHDEIPPANFLHS